MTCDESSHGTTCKLHLHGRLAALQPFTTHTDFACYTRRCIPLMYVYVLPLKRVVVSASHMLSSPLATLVN